MKKKTFLYIFIIILIVVVSAITIKNKIADEKVEDLPPQSDELDTPSGTKDDNINDNSNENTSDLEIKGYILSVSGDSVDLTEVLKSVNLEDKMPVYSQLDENYNSVAIIETNQKVGPIYLVDCNYDKKTNKYTIKQNSKQLLTEFIQNSDVLTYLNKVVDSTAKKAILVENNDKNYIYPLSTDNLDKLSATELIEIK